MHLLEVTEISKKVSDEFLLKDISFVQNEFQKIAIAGETGSGKSTLLKIIAGYEQPDSGEIHLGGKKLRGPNFQLIPGHEGVAYLSQYYELRNWYRVEELMDMASHLTDSEANKIYEICQVSHLLKRRTDHLSGGEKQRIALARLLVMSPRLLILDEPFSNIDMIHKRILKTVIRDVSQQMRITCIMTAHDPLDILPWADELIIMKNGSVIQQGTAKDVYEQPVNEYSAGLMGSYNVLSSALVQQFGLIERTSGQKTIIRPETLTLNTSGDMGVSGVVKDMYYLGSRYEVQVSANGTELTVFSERSYSVGEPVKITLK